MLTMISNTVNSQPPPHLRAVQDTSANFTREKNKNDYDGGVYCL